MIRELMNGGLLVQGITGRQGTLETGWMLASGTHVACGVTPGRGGERVHGVPVFDSVAEAVDATGAAVSMCYAPAPLVPDALTEAAEGGIRLAVVSAENVPVHGFVRATERARALGMTIIGPNSQGVVVPGAGRWGCPGGDDPWERFAAGPVGVVSRSGGVASEISLYLRQWGWGTSVQIATGGGLFAGTPLGPSVGLVQADAATRVAVVFGEPSGPYEYELARMLSAGEITVPVVAMVPGRAAETLPRTVPFGHAPQGRVLSETAGGKLTALADAGAYLARDFDEVRAHLDRILRPEGT